MRISIQIIGFCVLFFSTATFAQGGGPGGQNGPGGPGGNGNNNFEALGAAPVPEENPITEAKRVLGKILFWDEQLSSDNTVACGTCHQPAAGGADSRTAIHPGFDQLFNTDDDVIGSSGIRALDANGQPIDHSIFGSNPQVTSRATPSFLTSMFADSNFWDGRADDRFVDPLDESSTVIEEGGALESQAIGPILNTVEMAQEGRDWEDVIEKLSQVTPLALATNIPLDMTDALAGGQTYPGLFQAAFGDGEITPVRIAFAIATYERTLVPNETPWDLYIEGNDGAMTASQIAGWESFIDTPCANCHEPPLFSDDNFRNIGLRPSFEDLGRFEVSGQNNDRGEFRAPSLRNSGLRKALMHVGWVTDVEDALAFYNSGTSDTGHVQFTADQDGIPGTNVDIDELNVFADDPVRRAQLVDFIANALTDPRVEAETYPFDRPTLASELAQPVVGDVVQALSTADVITDASFSVTIEGGNTSNNIFSQADILSISAIVNVDADDVGQLGGLYCVVLYNGTWYAMTLSGGYQSWDGVLSNLPYARSRNLSAVENITVIDRLTGLTGDFAIYLAYENEMGELIYTAEPVEFSIQLE